MQLLFKDCYNDKKNKSSKFAKDLVIKGLLRF